MPFASEAQRKFLYARHPRIAKRWQKHTPKGKDLPEKVSEKKAYFLGYNLGMVKAALVSPMPSIPTTSGNVVPGSVASPLIQPGAGSLRARATAAASGAGRTAGGGVAGTMPQLAARSAMVAPQAQAKAAAKASLEDKEASSSRFIRGLLDMLHGSGKLVEKGISKVPSAASAVGSVARSGAGKIKNALTPKVSLNLQQLQLEQKRREAARIAAAAKQKRLFG